MSNTLFSVPKLTDNKAWLDYRGKYPGGYGWRYNRSLSNIKYAVNHHSVTNPSKNAKRDIDTLWNIHRANGWGGIGYNFVITSEEVKGKDGLMYAKVAYVGDIGSVRAHTTNAKGYKNLKAGYGNEYLIAACMIGQLHLKNPTQAQIRSAYWLYRELIEKEPKRLPKLIGKLSTKLTSHKEWDYTACSGKWIEYQRNAIIKYKDPSKPVVKTVTDTIAIAYLKETAEDALLPKGETKVIQKGVQGVRTIKTQVTTVDGKVTARKEVSNTVTRKPVNEITAVGTKTDKPEPLPYITKEDQEAIDKAQNDRLNAVEKLLKLVVDFLSSIFNGFKKG